MPQRCLLLSGPRQVIDLQTARFWRRSAYAHENALQWHTFKRGPGARQLQARPHIDAGSTLFPIDNTGKIV